MKINSCCSGTYAAKSRKALPPVASWNIRMHQICFVLGNAPAPLRELSMLPQKP